MKKIFLDTNFIIDLLLREEFKTTSQDFLAKGSLSGCGFYVSFLSIANFAYICRKLPPAVLYQHLKTIGELLSITSCTPEHIRSAMTLSAKDFEDALQYAVAIGSGCEMIITRNQKDFQFSTVPVMSAAEFMALHG